MKSLNALACAIAAAILYLTVPLLAAIQLVPVVSSGLSSPLFVGHAGDGSNRLFIVERAGIIKVLQPGSSSPTVFLDIRSRIASGGGEQGLLGLAFHPLYDDNGRFFVFYTRIGDGALVVAEYGLTGNPDVAIRLRPSSDDSSFEFHESQRRHARVRSRYLSLHRCRRRRRRRRSDEQRAEHQRAAGETAAHRRRYPSRRRPVQLAVNEPVFWNDERRGTRSSRMAFGTRGVSASTATPRQLWLADVGQGAFEEVDTPIVSGGNYGWDRFEGFDCTSTTDCDATGLIFPVFDCTHSGGRCSITGG